MKKVIIATAMILASAPAFALNITIGNGDEVEIAQSTVDQIVTALTTEESVTKTTEEAGPTAEELDTAAKDECKECEGFIDENDEMFAEEVFEVEAIEEIIETVDLDGLEINADVAAILEGLDADLQSQLGQLVDEGIASADDINSLTADDPRLDPSYRPDGVSDADPGK